MGLTNWFKKLNNKDQQQISAGDLKKLIISLTGKSSGISLLEAGASGGEDTLEWAACNEIKNIYAFEPVIRSFDYLNDVLNGNEKVSTYKLALSDKRGETEINVSVNTKRPDGLPSSSSLLQPTGHLDFHSHIKFDQKEKVVITTIDDWAHENNVSAIDIMWLDMQGAEHLALKGGRGLLKTTQVIYSEVSLKTMYNNSLLYPEYKALLNTFGFSVHSEYLYWNDMGNVLFVRK